MICPSWNPLPHLGHGDSFPCAKALQSAIFSLLRNRFLARTVADCKQLLLALQWGKSLQLLQLQLEDRPGIRAVPTPVQGENEARYLRLGVSIRGWSLLTPLCSTASLRHAVELAGLEHRGLTPDVDAAVSTGADQPNIAALAMRTPPPRVISVVRLCRKRSVHRAQESARASCSDSPAASRASARSRKFSSRITLPPRNDQSW